MWQDIRLSNPNGHSQFLGDMFEGFLDQGVKQSEGQFFTPMPQPRPWLSTTPAAPGTSSLSYGDGLVSSHAAFPDIRDGHFELLVANPPYSVRGFLETLPEEECKA